MEKVTFKQIGQNVMLTVEGKPVMSKKFTEKVDRDNIKALVEVYTKKPTKKALDTILKFMTLVTEKIKEEKIVAKKVAKQEEKATKVAKKVEKKIEKKIDKVSLLKKENAELKAKLAAYETKPEPKPQARGRREH